MLKKILVGLGDVEYSASATQQAIALAKQHEAQLAGAALLDIDELDLEGPVPIGAGHLANELRDSRLETAREVIEKATSNFEQSCKENGIPYQILHENGEPYESFVACARYHDITVCGLKALFKHGVSDEPPVGLIKLVQEGVRPLVAVSNKVNPINRVLICYSGSMESAKTMRRFVQLRLWENIHLKIVTFEKEENEAKQFLTDAAAYCRAHGHDPEVEYVSSKAKDNLLPYATDWSADLIVMGNSAKNLLLRRILGETTLHVVRHTEIPLFLCQ